MLLSYNPWLVVLSLATACFTFYSFMSVVQRVSLLAGSARKIAFAASALTTGSGIWAIHYFGMLALKLPTPLYYDMPLTLLSWTFNLVTTVALLWLIPGCSGNIKKTALLGAVAGCCFTGTHFLGMAALNMHPVIRYHHGLVLLALFLAIGSTCAAIWICTRFTPATRFRHKVTASLLVGLGFSAMHYAAMAATMFPAGGVSVTASLSASSADMTVLLGVCLLLLLMLALGNIFAMTRFSAWQLLLLLGLVESVVLFTLLRQDWIAHYYTLATVLDAALLIMFMTPVFWRLQINSRSLALEKERSQTILASIGDAVIVVDTDDHIEFLNPLAEEMIGWKLDEVRGLPLSQIFHLIDGDSGEPMEDPTAKVLREGFVVDIGRGTLLVRKDGREYAIEDSAAPIIGDNRQVTGVVMVFRDITAQLKQEQELRASNERWQFALESNNDALWDWNLQSGFVYFSAAYHRMYGYQEGELAAHESEWIGNLHPDDLHPALEVLREYLQGKLPLYTVEFRMRCKDGSWKWVLSRGKLISRDPQGNPLRMIGTHTDISVYKNQQSELLLADAVFEQNAESIVITDAAENRIIRVNPAFTRITGYQAEEVIGKSPRYIHADSKHDDEFFQNMQETLDKYGHWQGEIWNRRKNGEVYPEQVSISAVKNARGEVQYYVGISSDISKDKEAETLIHDLAYYDVLTGLPNRLLLDDRLKVALANAARNDKFVALLFLDLDHFKEVNDTLGHSAGDRLLMTTAERILDCVREGDTVARQGGDEFVLLLPDLTDTDDAVYAASTVAEKIREVLNQPFDLDGFEAAVTPSMGIAIFPSDADNMEELIRNADTAMYHAKNTGRNNFQFYAADMSSGALNRLSMDNALRHAIKQKEFELLYQPQVDMLGNILSVEALLRWNNPALGTIPPKEFIPLAEENGLILSIGQWVLDTACAQKKAWNAAGLCEQPMRIAVNISQRQFGQSGFVENLLETLSRFGIASSEIELEMTESILMHNTRDTLKKLDELKVLGFKISVDDFGTGYSSLAYLKHFPVDVLKIDQSFVQDIGSDVDDMAIARAIISMAKNLNLMVIAEGVETAEQLEFLHNNGCDAYQGFLFNPAMSGADVTRLLRDRSQPK